MIIRRIHNMHQLAHRPLVSKFLSEYVYHVFDEWVLRPKKVLQSTKTMYSITLDFSVGSFTPKGFPGILDANEIEKQLYGLPDSYIIHPNNFSYFDGSEKNAHIHIIDPKVNNKVSNDYYAHIVAAMFHKFLAYKYQKIVAADFELVVTHLEPHVLRSFENPCAFKEQDYVLDSHLSYDYYKMYQR